MARVKGHRHAMRIHPHDGHAAQINLVPLLLLLLVSPCQLLFSLLSTSYCTPGRLRATSETPEVGKDTSGSHLASMLATDNDSRPT